MGKHVKVMQGPQREWGPLTGAEFIKWERACCCFLGQHGQLTCFTQCSKWWCRCCSPLPLEGSSLFPFESIGMENIGWKPIFLDSVLSIPHKRSMRHPTQDEVNWEGPTFDNISGLASDSSWSNIQSKSSPRTEIPLFCLLCILYLFHFVFVIMPSSGLGTQCRPLSNAESGI